ncbi:uncharacterized protein ANIA_11657 [Aspergillus nidulans FGSC A4]|uniref:Uncharacterized protein n=1 Tax=Emericella nidulans (strain FGSC A4 / ATCC 38163 / CBS 112.46 / NRRL 194 / M139) TaxID=227321 RepID=C8VR51_EMENI|nr:hypothetical protein [Aspergillus nidulans FGSC A4]CBF87449.1 TPA: hypothetical protein ANIA_11657 [Aspergillus nidulans FGSC A4]
MRFFSTILPIALIAGASALTSEDIRDTEDGYMVITAQCSDDYWTCLTSCPLTAPASFCITWPLTCTIIYC